MTTQPAADVTVEPTAERISRDLAAALQDAIVALHQITDPAERARAAREVGDTMQEGTAAVANVRIGCMVELRQAGWTRRAAGDALGISGQRVQALLARAQAPDVEEPVR